MLLKHSEVLEFQVFDFGLMTYGPIPEMFYTPSTLSECTPSAAKPGPSAVTAVPLFILAINSLLVFLMLPACYECLGIYI